MNTGRIYKLPTVVMSKNQFIIQHSQGRTVMHVGCVGQDNVLTLHHILQKITGKVYGVDTQLPPTTVQDFYLMDATTSVFSDLIKTLRDVELILIPDVIEHLANPGMLLAQLVKTQLPFVITIPNATRLKNFRRAFWNAEQVNEDHVAWYSFATLTNLVEQYKYRVVNCVMTGEKPIYKFFPGFCGGIAMRCEYLLRK